VADLVQRQEDDDQAAGDQQGHLDDVGQGHGLQAAPQLIGQGEDADDHQGGHLVDAGHRVDGDRAQPQDRGQVHEDVEDQPEHRHHVADAGSVPLLQELRHGADVVLQEDRQEELADDQQGQGRHPLIGGDGQAQGIARAAHADDLLGRDVGGDQRGADRPPGQGLAGQEVVGRVLLLAALVAGNPLGQAEDGDGVDRQDDEIDGLHGASPRGTVVLDC
jgi:hypothetical protein